MFLTVASLRFILVASALVVYNSFGDAKPLDLLNDEAHVFRKEFQDIPEGNREVRVYAGTHEIQIGSGCTQQEMFLIVVGGTVLSIFVVCCCCWACLKCCGESRT